MNKIKKIKEDLDHTIPRSDFEKIQIQYERSILKQI